MSHQPERAEKNCLNCGTTVAGRYCQACGQENIVTKQSFWALTKHFVYDIFHFDGKFFDTLASLLLKPGKVAREYISGKRMSYLDPIRMYLFTSAVFFLVFFSTSGVTDNLVRIDDDGRTMTKIERLEYASLLNYQMKSGTQDSVLQTQLNYLLDTTYSLRLYTTKGDWGDTAVNIRLDGKDYIMSVDSMSERIEADFNMGSSWLDRKMENKWKKYKEKFADDDRALFLDLVGNFMHKFPYILFISLPFFALILKLLYVRRKQFFYSDHAIFTLYQYIFTFLLLLIYFMLQGLHDWTGWGIFRLIAVLLFLSGGVYLLLAMKRFYVQGWGKTILKFILLNILAFLVMNMIMLAFIVFSIFQL